MYIATIKLSSMSLVAADRTDMPKVSFPFKMNGERLLSPVNKVGITINAETIMDAQVKAIETFFGTNYKELVIE